jgi:hypothetical protein
VTIKARPVAGRSARRSPRASSSRRSRCAPAPSISTIEKDIDGDIKTYQFVRADRISSKDDLIAMAIAKGRQIIDEQGEGIFSQAWPRKPN